jgi:hypothetical protein
MRRRQGRRCNTRRPLPLDCTAQHCMKVNTAAATLALPLLLAAPAAGAPALTRSSHPAAAAALNAAAALCAAAAPHAARLLLSARGL